MNHQPASHPNLTGLLKHWTLHITPLSEENRYKFKQLRPGLMPAVCTGEVIIDHRGRFPTGTAMITSLVKSFDLQNFLVHTASGSVYQLAGRGEIRWQGAPSDYTEAVGQQILRNSARQ